MPRKGQVTRSVRIDKEADAELRRLAAEQGVSVNLLANKALRRFAEWDAYGEKFGFLSLPSGLLLRLMDYLTDDEARELGAWVGKDLIREYVMFWFKEETPENVVEAFPRLFAKYGRSFDYDEQADGPLHTAILKHNGGKRWSIFYAQVMETAFHEILSKQVRLDLSENQVVARFRLP